MAKKILVVDDEPDMQAFLAAVLEDNGYETMTASDGDEALEKIKSCKPDLVSLDLLMPNKTGFKLFRELRKDPETAHIPVVMVTGLTAEDIPQLDFRKFIQERSLRPPDAYIEKPVNTKLLLDALKQAIGGD